MTQHGWVAIGVVGMMALGACAPNTVIRRTALINAPQAPTREGQPLDKGDVRIVGHVSGVNSAHDGDFFVFTPGFAEVGDPGVLIPDLQIGGSVWAGLPGGLEIGGQLYYASMDWADPNVAGVLPFPRGEEEDLLMGGIGLRLNVALADPRLALAFLGEVNVATIPEAIFVCTDTARCGSDRVSNDFTGQALYTFDRVERETFFLPQLAVQFGWRFGDIPGLVVPDGEGASPREAANDEGGVRLSVMPYLSVGVQQSVTNTGFEDDPSTLAEDSLEALWIGSIALGVDALIDRLVLGASLMLPFEGEDAIDFGVVANFRIGVQL